MPRLLPPLLTTTDRTASRFTRDAESLGAGSERRAVAPGRVAGACSCSVCPLITGPVAAPGRRPEPPGCPRPRPQARVNEIQLLFVLVGMSAIPHVTRGELPPNADAAVRLPYSRHAEAPNAYVVRFCPDRASAGDIVQETFIRAWRHLPQLTAGRRLGIPSGTARSRPHYAGQAFRQHLQDHDATAA